MRGEVREASLIAARALPDATLATRDDARTTQDRRPASCCKGVFADHAITSWVSSCVSWLTTTEAKMSAKPSATGKVRRSP